MDFKGDLLFLYQELLHHPLLIRERSKREQFDELYHKVYPVTDFDSLISAATALTLFFEDGHTNIELPYTAKDLCIPIPCEWDGDRLVLTASYREIPVGSEILAIEDVPIPELVEKLAGRIPHENIFLVKSRMIHYPYRNYHLFSDLNLRRLFSAKRSYQVSFSGNHTVNCPLAPYRGYPCFEADRLPLSSEIVDNRLILHLNACVYNDDYLKSLENAAATCSAEHIHTLELDLSRNMGGSSAVIEPFIRYVDVGTFRRYEMIDYSTGEARCLSSRQETVCNNKMSLLFPTDIECRVSFDTFSSAKAFAVTLKDNGIARIIGAPSGGKPNSHGLPRKFMMPCSGIRFRVSTSFFLRPDSTFDNESALFPEK